MLIKYWSLKKNHMVKNSLKCFVGYNDDEVIRPFLIMNLIMNLMESLNMNLLTINLKVKIVF